ncbi:MAG: NADAR family protein [Lachnospiraceae bacterium]|jgi:ribA/ribD-fused uncharacterized protein|nr:NADAR family protein [Lachnospiraceae bacterium]MCX4315460.1 NADAR family protein [Lachnospiraceae bacterium]
MKEKKTMLPPPWIAYPEIERYSIGWRMGYGEEYICRWGGWWETLTEKEQNTYQELFPEPVTWKGYWQEVDEEGEEDEEEYEEDDTYYQRGDYGIELWRKKGRPKYFLKQIREEYTAGKKQEYLFFWSARPSKKQVTKGCLSQWWKSDFRSVNHTYCCMEQFMMANKAELFGDEETRKEILQADDPKQMKALGRKVKSFQEVVWEEVKYSIVLNGNYYKFTQSPELRKFLLSTGDAVLVEASPYDGIWGIRMGEGDEQILNPWNWKGENLLGFALMEVRDEIRRVWKNEGMLL